MTPDQQAWAARIGERLANARAAAGMTQLQAAAAIGYRNSTQLSLVERGKRPATRTLLDACAQLYGVTVTDLAGEHDEAVRPPSRGRCGETTVRHTLRELIAAAPGSTTADLLAKMRVRMPTVKPATVKSTLVMMRSQYGEIRLHVDPSIIRGVVLRRWHLAASEPPVPPQRAGRARAKPEKRPAAAGPGPDTAVAV